MRARDCGVPTMDDAAFGKILRFFDLSWQGYRKVRKGVKKRVASHMQSINSRTVDEYLTMLQSHPEQRQRAIELLTVSISRFFRDRRLWDVLQERVVPNLVGTAGVSIRIWSAGCACGEEVYSVKILWEQLKKRYARMPPLEIWATDINPLIIEKARRALYPSSSLKELSPVLRDEYFTPVMQAFVLRPELQQGIRWMLHDLTRDDPPETCFDLILLRNNLLTYYDPTIMDPAFQKIMAALRWGGYLIIGNKEQIPSMDIPLRNCPDYRSVFIKSFTLEGNHHQL
jgi:chemotaxis protein methyltransferase CheR